MTQVANTAPSAVRLHGGGNTDVPTFTMTCPTGTPAPIPGDWLTTPAGARYQVANARKMPTTRHAQQDRWRVQVTKLAKGAPVPDGVREIKATW